jgi:hypothetical protein
MRTQHRHVMRNIDGVFSGGGVMNGSMNGDEEGEELTPGEGILESGSLALEVTRAADPLDNDDGGTDTLPLTLWLTLLLTLTGLRFNNDDDDAEWINGGRPLPTPIPLPLIPFPFDRVARRGGGLDISALAARSFLLS